MTTTNNDDPSYSETITLRRFVDGKGEGGLANMVYRKHECGCKVIGNGTLQHPLAVQFCDLHLGVKKDEAA
jgi:hypothetical protein